MLIHPGGQGLHFLGELRQRRGVAFRQLLDAAGQRLRHAIQFGLHVGGQGRQPFVVHHQGLDLVLGERLAYLAATLASSAFCASFTFLLAPRLPVRSGRGSWFSTASSSAASGSSLISLSASLDAGLGELALVGLGFGQQPVLAAVFLVQFFHLAGDGLALGFQLFDGLLLGGKIAAR